MHKISKVNLEPVQILGRPCKLNIIIDPYYIYKIIYNTGNNQYQPQQLLHLPCKINLHITYKTLFATRLTLQLNQNWDQRRKINFITRNESASYLKCHLQYKQNQPRTSPNSAPAMQNAYYNLSALYIKYIYNPESK